MRSTRSQPHPSTIGCCSKTTACAFSRHVIPAGESTAIHTHRWANVQHVVNATQFVRRDGEGTVLVDTRADRDPPRSGLTHWSEPLPPHLIENVGDAELRVIMVELKS